MPGLVTQEPMVQTPPWRRGDGINLRAHFGGGQEGVLAAVHRRAARMGRLAVEGDGVALDAEGAEHGAQRQIQVQQHRPLLDVQFQVGGGVLEFLPALLGALQVHADFLQARPAGGCRPCP